MDKIKESLMLKQLINLCIETTDTVSRMLIADKKSGKNLNDITQNLIKDYFMKYGEKTPEMVCFENMKEELDKMMEIKENCR